MGKARKHTPEQIVNILRQIKVAVANGKTTPAASREAGITEQTYYRWRKEYGGLKVDQAKRLKELEQENAKLKRLVANLSLEKLVLKDIAEGKLLNPERRRFAVSRGCERAMSERRTCRLVNQPHLRHAKADTTANEYMQELPKSVKKMVGSVYTMLMKGGDLSLRPLVCRSVDDDCDVKVALLLLQAVDIPGILLDFREVAVYFSVDARLGCFSVSN